MVGETNLRKLLASMSPVLMSGEYVFYSFNNARYGDHSELNPIIVVTESEGLTLVIPKSKAVEYELDYDSVFKGITLTVHSSLNAVGV